MKDDPKFEPYILKDYKFWRLYIHQNQTNLGRVYLWAKREDVTNLLEVTDEELLEFKQAATEAGQALEKVFQADWLNFEFLGNETAHLHCHIIPRYKTPREFEGIKFEDKNWGRPAEYRLITEVSEEILMKIKSVLKAKL